MRSGSTLLKALLAEAEDVSNLPEVNFQTLRDSRTAPARLAQLASEPLVVLKRPAWYHETRSYPRLPALDDFRALVLVRDAYDTVLSLRKMTFGRLSPWLGRLTNRWLAERYWATVNLRLRDTLESLAERATLVRYEDLVADPVSETARLFAFIGSRQTAGVDRYRKPASFAWRWGRDDGGEKITSLRVQPPRHPPQREPALLRAIAEAPQVQAVRQWLGYSEERVAKS